MDHNGYGYITIVTLENVMEKTIAAGRFKTYCLQLMDDVREKHLTFVITKHGTPIAKLVPIEEQVVNLYGALKGTVKIKGDIIAPIDEKWDVES
jgi:antitoxin (DNA-binding transcriptional repressor) of toxin-antitoxin stability system